MRIQTLRGRSGDSRLVLDYSAGGERLTVASKVFDIDEEEGLPGSYQTIRVWGAGEGWSHMLLGERHILIARGFGTREAESWEDLVQEAKKMGVDLSGVSERGRVLLPH